MPEVEVLRQGREGNRSKEDMLRYCCQLVSTGCLAFALEPGHNLTNASSQLESCHGQTMTLEVFSQVCLII